MNLPMSEGPRDGDYARYVEQLSGGGVPPAAPAAAPSAVSGAASSAGASSGAQGQSASSARRPPARAGGKRGPVTPVNAMARLIRRLAMAGMILIMTRMFSPRFMTATMVLLVAWLIGTLIRDWARQHPG